MANISSAQTSSHLPTILSLPGRITRDNVDAPVVARLTRKNNAETSAAKF
jgi:hypothetical protein